jgi:hypothetical protein
MTRKFLIVLLVLALLGTGLYFYINKVFIPVKLKEIVSGQIEKSINRKVSIAKIHFNLLKGFGADDVTIFEPESESVFVHVDKISFGLLFSPIFKNKVIVIPYLELTKPYVSVVKTAANTWNFSDLLKLSTPAETRAKAPSNNYSFILKKLNIDEGKIDYTDQTLEKPFSETVSDIDLRVNLNLSKKAKYTFGASIPSRQTLLKSGGEFTLDAKNITADIAAQNLYLSEYAALFLDPKINVLKSGTLGLAEVHLTYANNAGEASGHFNIMNAAVVLNEEQRFSGNLIASPFTATYKNGVIDGSGELNLQSAVVAFPPIHLDKTDLSLKASSFHVSGEDVSFKGDLSTSKAALKMDPSLELAGELKSSNVQFSKTKDTIQLSGDHTLSDFHFLSDQQSLDGNLVLTKSALSFKPGHVSFQGEATSDKLLGLLPLNDNLILKIDTSFSAKPFSLTQEGDNIGFNGTVDMSRLLVDMGNGMTIQDAPQLELSLQMNLKDPLKAEYKGSLNIKDAIFNGVPQVKTVSGTSGKITFETNKVSTDKLVMTAMNMPIVMSGTISDFSNLYIDAEVSADNILLENITPILSSYLKDVQLEAKGKGALKAKFKGHTNDTPHADINAYCKLDQAEIVSDKLPGGKVSNASGEFQYEKDRILLKEIKATLLDDAYTLNGELVNFEQPSVSLTLSSPKGSATTQMQMLDKILNITSLKGDLFKSSFDISGSVDLKDDKAPYANLNGNVKLDLNDLMVVPQLKELVSQYKPTGILNIEHFLLKGAMPNWRNWDMQFDITSPQISVMDHPIEQLNVAYEQSNQKINKMTLTSTVYEGAVSFETTADLSDDKFPAQLHAKVDKLNLAALKKETKGSNQNLAGILNFEVNTTGPLLDKNQIYGEGSLTVVDGYLGQIGLLNGIAGALLVIPQFKNLFITDAQMNFVIKDGRVNIANSVLANSIAPLKVDGWISFDNQVDINVVPELSDIAMAQSDSAKNLPTFLLSHAIAIKCTGQMNQPQCGLDKSPTRVLNETTDILKEGIKGVGGILQDIF